MQTITLPRKANQGGTLFNQAAVAQAAQELGIEDDIKIKFANGRRRLGAWRQKMGHHGITISTYSDPVQASKTLWHELTHAKQAEEHRRAGKIFGLEYNRETAIHGGGMRGYRANRFEVEANEVADKAIREGKLLDRYVAAKAKPEPQQDEQVGTGNRVVQERKSRKSGRVVQVVDGKLDQAGAEGGRWIVRVAGQPDQRHATRRGARNAASQQ